MKHKLLFRRLLASLLLLAVSTLSWAYSFQVNGIYYNTNSDGKTVTVTLKYGNDYSGAVTIPASVTSGGRTYSVTDIGNSAFMYCSGLTSVTIPEGVTTIQTAAFHYCSGLTSVKIPNSVTSIEGVAFAGCSQLSSVTMGSGVKSIEHNTFDRCAKLESIYIPEGVTSIGQNAFRNCSKLASINIPEGVTSIGQNAFSGCSSLKSIIIPASVSSIEDGAFKDCSSLSSVTINSDVIVSSNRLGSIFGSQVVEYVIGNGVTCISDYAFQGCSGCTSIKIPESVTSIGKEAFYGCSGITSVHLGSGLTNIGDNAFYGCSGLTSINIPESVTSIAERAFSGCSGLTSISIPNSVTNIGSGAFSGCSKLTSITIPNSVTSIGSYSFSGCSSLASAVIGNNVTSIDQNAFSGCTSLTSITIYSDAIASQSYDSYTKNNTIRIFGSQVKEFIFGGGVTSIGANAFRGYPNLSTVTIGNSVTSIGSGAFDNCSNLPVEDGIRYADTYLVEVTDKSRSAYTIKEGTRFIGPNAFSGCYNLTSINIPESVTSIGDGAFNNCSGLSVEDGIRYADTYLVEVIDKSRSAYTIKEGTRFIGSNAFSGCSNLTSISIPNSLTSIDGAAFSGCSGLTSIAVDVDNVKYDSRNNCNAIIETSSNTLIVGCKNTVIPESVTTIGSSAFEGCSSLTSVNIPNSVIKINQDAFRNCTGLTSVTIGSGVTSIGFQAFEGCSGLTSITIPESVTSIGGRAFAYCTGFNSFTIGSGVTKIGYYAFHGCTGLTSMTISESVTEIEHDAFIGCSSLTSIFIPKNVTKIHRAIFASCRSLASIKVDPNNTVYNSRNDCNAIIYGGTLVAGCKNTIIPDGITKIDNYAFSGCSGLTSITIPESVTSIEVSAFSGCTGLTSLTIPSKVTHLDDYAFSGCSNLTMMTCMATNVPRTTLNPFNNTPIGSAILYVPEESLEAYKAAAFWKEFGAILAIGDVPETESLNYYDMNGIKKFLVDRDKWADIQKNTPNALAVVESEQAEWASQQKNVLVTNSDGSHSCADFLLTDLTQGFSTNASEAAKTGFFTPVSFKATKGTYKRQAYAGYNTLCLPFSFKASDLSSSAKVFTFDTYDAEGSKVIFKAVSGPIAAGTPCIVKEKTDVVWTVNLSGKTIEAAQPSEDSHMRGTYVTTDALKGKGYSPRSSDGRFAPLTQYLHPFRACFSLEELDAAARGSLSAVFMDEDGVTAIDTLSAADNTADTPKSIYTLSGQRVKEIKRSGLYIVNGKKQYIEVK